MRAPPRGKNIVSQIKFSCERQLTHSILTMSFQSSLAKIFRSAGQSLDAVGRKFEVNAYVETRKSWIFLHLNNSIDLPPITSIFLVPPLLKLVKPSTRSIKFGQNTPSIKGAFIAPSASVIGNVDIGASSSVWYGAVVRGRSQ